MMAYGSRRSSSATSGRKNDMAQGVPLMIDATHPTEPSPYESASMTSRYVIGSDSAPPSDAGRSMRGMPASDSARTSSSGNRRSDSIRSTLARIVGTSARAASTSRLAEVSDL